VQLSVLTPEAAAVALVVLVPLLAFRRMRGIGRGTRRALGLSEPPRRAFVVPAVALVVLAALLGSAAAQPVVSTTRTARVRTDAEAIFALDTSRSMLASGSAGSPTRIERAKTDALALRRAIPSVPVGLASVTDRTLPHLFPTADERVFRTTLQEAIGVDRPPPERSLLTRATSLESLGAIETRGFFSPSAKRRVLVVFTDGETVAGTRARLGPLFLRPPGVSTLFVHVSHHGERVYTRGAPEIGYRTDPTSRAALEQIAEGIGGKVVGEDDTPRAARLLQGLVGKGPTVAVGRQRRDVALSAPLAAAAVFPLVLLLWRRNR
jgi:hypothetical protein